ncbi:MAG: hypothetical protein GPJ51_03795 [Candidatus Heimdallarchaeota archaeon]|nr:hypothetical protein [Candidatus Heimdallarchaeota archaeon]
MRTKWIIITVTLVIIILGSILLPVFFLIPDNTVNEPSSFNYLYPTPIFNNGTFSDLVVEEDDKVHFSIMSYDFSNWGPVYAFLDLQDFSNHSFTFELIKRQFSGDNRELRIFLDQNKTPLIYWYFYDGQIALVERYYTLNNEIWVIPAFFDNTTTRRTMGKLFNLNFNQFNKIRLASRCWGENIEPTIFYEEDSNFVFLSDIFPQIKDYKNYTPGDFRIESNRTALIWKRYLNSTSYYPILAIEWEDKNWTLFELGTDEDQFIPLSIFYTNDHFNAFFYDSGSISGNTTIYSVEVYNSSYYETSQIVEIEGIIDFHQDSICSFGDNNFVFLYSKHENDTYDISDLYMGTYDGYMYLEFQITQTDELYERWANCDIGENYFHYTWTTTKNSGSEWFYHPNSVQYYNRIPISSLLEANISVDMKKNIRCEGKTIIGHAFSTKVYQNYSCFSLLEEMYVMIFLYSKEERICVI